MELIGAFIVGFCLWMAQFLNDSKKKKELDKERDIEKKVKEKLDKERDKLKNDAHINVRIVENLNNK